MNQTRDLSRLPKWAQIEIENLRTHVEHLQAKLNIGPEGSNTFVRDYVNGNRPLGASPWILFALGDPDDYEAGQFELRLVDETLEVRSSGGNGPAISPIAGNVIEITLRPRAWWHNRKVVHKALAEAVSAERHHWDRADDSNSVVAGQMADAVLDVITTRLGVNIKD